MEIRAVPQVLIAVLLLASLACASTGGSQAGEEQNMEVAVVVGPTSREAIEAAAPEWVQAEVEAQPEAEAAQALATVAPGAEVTVFLGTWCGDSRREVPRLWRALDESGVVFPFRIRYLGVDRAKQEPADEIGENGIRFVPTFIVSRDGREVGRIVETAPHGIEKDLLALLTGQATGVIAIRDDLAASGDASKHPL